MALKLNKIVVANGAFVSNITGDKIKQSQILSAGYDVRKFIQRVDPRVGRTIIAPPPPTLTGSFESQSFSRAFDRLREV